MQVYFLEKCIVNFNSSLKDCSKTAFQKFERCIEFHYLITKILRTFISDIIMDCVPIDNYSLIYFSLLIAVCLLLIAVCLLLRNCYLKKISTE